MVYVLNLWECKNLGTSGLMRIAIMNPGMHMMIIIFETHCRCSKGRVIVRQGHVGYNFYFIFSGSVFVQVDVLDTASGITTTNNVNTLGRGTCFGVS